MGKPEIFFIRLVLSIMFAFLLSRFFFHNMPMIKVFGLAIIMLGLAYVIEFLRKRNRTDS
jgi:Flp pilus assembly protein TadB